MMIESWRRLSAAVAASLLVSSIFIGGCGIQKSPSNNMNPKSYGHDGYMGLSNSNPRLFNRNGSYVNYGSDGNFAERKLKELGGIDNYTLTFRGPKLFVDLKAAPGVDPVQLRQKALSTLSFNMPRYDVHVTAHR